MRIPLLLLLMLYSISEISAQTGPAGVGQTNGSSELVLWLDANTINQIDNSDITTWTDQSGYGNDATSETGFEPILKTNRLNGFKGIEFRQANTEYLKVADDASLNPNEISVFVVGYYRSNSNDYVPFVVKSDNWNWENGYGISRYTGTTIRGFVSDHTENFVESVVSEQTTTIMSLIYDKTNVSTYDNGTANGTDAYTLDIDNTTNDLHIGISPDGTSGIGTGVLDPLNGDIYEVIIIDRDVNTAERIIIENYLAAKYGLTLGANDIYNEDDGGNGNYDYDVSGIGQASDGSNHTDAQGTDIVRILNPSNLGNNEFLMWGHDNGSLSFSNTTDIDTNALGSRLNRVWRASEVNLSNTGVDVGDIDIRWNLSDLGIIDEDSLALLVDTDNDGLFIDETPIFGATDLGSNVYGFIDVTTITNNARFTLGYLTEVENDDFDGDGVINSNDIDIDNDGILDINETNCLVSAQSASDVVNHSGDGDATRRANVTDGTTPNSGNHGYRLNRVGEHLVVDLIDLGLKAGSEVTVTMRINNTNAKSVRFSELTSSTFISNGGTNAVSFDISDFSATNTNQDFSYTLQSNTRYLQIEMTERAGGRIGVMEVTVDANACQLIDTDGDNIPNHIDLDSDNDGIPDNVEAQTTTSYVAPSGGDDDGDGLDNAYDANDSNTDPTISAGIDPENTDGTDEDDYLDTDSDNDGFLDIDESGNNLPDANDDGQTDDPVGDNGLDDNIDETGNEDGFTDPNGIINSPSTDLDDTDNNAGSGGDVNYRDSTIVTNANDESITVVENIGGAAIINVLANDSINGNPATIAVVDISIVTPSADAGITLNTSTGDIDVSMSASAGEYTIVYRVCENGGTSFCNDATVSIVVQANLDGDETPDVSDQDDDNDGILDVDETDLELGTIETPINVFIDLDEYENETTWTLEGPGGFSQSGGPYLDADDIIDLDFAVTTLGSYVFTIFDSFGDGMDFHSGSDENGTSSYSISLAGTTIFASAPSPSFESTDVVNFTVALSPDLQIDIDTDDDTIPDRLDLDSDNDGITDIIEAGGVDIDNDGRVDDDTDTDGDGWADEFDSDNGGDALTDPDSDGDGFTNRIDLDSDSDGITDNVEAQSTIDFVAPLGSDVNGNGWDNRYDETSGGTSITLSNINGTKGPDYLDLDSDSDGAYDYVEGFDDDGNGDALDDLKERATAYETANGNPGHYDNASSRNSERNAIPSWLQDDNSNGRPNFLDAGNVHYFDDDNDGLVNLFDTDQNGQSVNLRDSDGDGEWDFRDTDNIILLPVELIDFTAIVEGQKVKLEWFTASELNNDYFTIERSPNAADWEDIKTVEGQGSTFELSSYLEYDENPLLGISYYRLKQTDFDGSFSYSEIKSVSIQKLNSEEETTTFKIFPNPTSGLVYVKASQSELAIVSIHNILGQDVTQNVSFTRINETTLALNLSTLKRDIYFIRTNQHSEKIYKQ